MANRDKSHRRFTSGGHDERPEDVAKERDAWRQEAWEVYLECGEDPDGADARHLSLGEVLAAVQELRKEADGQA